jgi:hypothetical protein
MSVEIKITPKKTIQTTSLGRAIRFGVRSKVVIDEPGTNIEYLVNSVNMTIGIGNDHIAHLTMTEEAYLALQDPDNRISIETIQDHIKQIKHARKRSKK